MKKEHKVIALSFSFGVFLWFVDATVDYLFFYKGSSLWAPIHDVPYHELYMRGIVLVCFVVFGLLMAGMVARLRRAEQRTRESEERFRSVVQTASDAIVSIDSNADIVFGNGAAEEMFGYPIDQITGRRIDHIVPNAPGEISWSEFIQSTRSNESGCMRKMVELMGVTENGQSFPIELSVSSWRAMEEVFLTVMMRDISERKKAEEELREYHAHLERMVEERTSELRETNKQLERQIAERKRAEAGIERSLKEKELLLQEIHHRVKNNMQVVSSMLNLQTGYIQNPEVLELLTESQNRVRTMALIHEKLYQSSDLGRIDFADYLEDLTSRLVRSYGFDNDSVAIGITAEGVLLGLDTAIPCGLIVNELVSNSLKHAFPKGRKGKIKVEIQSENGHFVLNVSDDGVGLPKDFDFRNTDTLGLQLVHTLTDQLDGTVELRSNGKGAEFKIRFKEPGSSRAGKE